MLSYGYGIHALTRQQVLQVLHDTIEDKSKVLVSKKVIEIENLEDRVVVTTSDGGKIYCELVAGADGVHSTVRRFIRQEDGLGKVQPGCK